MAKGVNLGRMTLSLTNEDFRNSFLDGTFVVDCLEIKLTQNGVDNPKVYTSPGYIHVSHENGVEARLIIPRSEDDIYDPFADAMEAANIQSGTIFSESRYFKLTARDVIGNTWMNPVVAVKIDNRSSAIILSLSCDVISTESHVEKPEYFSHMIFMDALEFPKNVIIQKNVLERNKRKLLLSASSSSGDLGGVSVTFNPREGNAGKVFYELYSESQLSDAPPIHFQERLIEAVRFCTATLAAPVMSETVHGNVRTIELSKARTLNTGLVKEPLDSRGNEEDFYRLMACYYKYSCKNANGRDFAPLSAKLGGLFTLKGVWLDTIALLVAVAVESLLGDEPFKTLGKPDKGLLSEIEKLFAWVKAATIDVKLIGRALSSMGSMKSTRAADKLNALVELGAIHEMDRKAWKDLRNPAAHGSFEIDPLQLQKLLDDIYRLITLIYKLIFIKIGYEGKYSDRSTHGWPIVEFNLPAELNHIDVP